jgi:hypothetical protein
MSVDRQEAVNRVERARTDEAFEVAESARDPGIRPRVIPVVVVILIGVVLLVLFYVAPWG